jgi:hypothetical protein
MKTVKEKLLTCVHCRNSKTFVARYLYVCTVDNKGDKLEPEEMDDEPKYQCAECRSYEVYFVDKDEP